MDPQIRNAVVVGGLAVLVPAAVFLRRRHGLVAWIVLALALGSALCLGVIDPSGLKVLAAAVPTEAAVRLAAWALLGVLVHAARGVGPARFPLLGAFVGGAAFGGPAAGLALAYGRDPRSAARIVVCAAGGGLCGPLGNEAALLLGFPGIATVPLGLALAGVAAVGRPLPREGGGSPILGVAAPVAWATALCLGANVGLLVGLLAAGGAAWIRRSPGPIPRPSRLAWAVAVLGSAWILAPSGAVTWLSDALRWAPSSLGGLGVPLVGAASLAMSLLVTPFPGVVAVRVATSADPSLIGPALHALVVAGAGVGSLLALLVVAGPGVLRAGALRLLAALGLALAFVAVAAF
ncbi:MAG: hypothetical protein JXB39_02660 [Deltaproteobacteria bacterium]|nr:hypothetical protein [Deltaproteobacteria bacterium]